GDRPESRQGLTVSPTRQRGFLLVPRWRVGLTNRNSFLVSFVLLLPRLLGSYLRDSSCKETAMRVLAPFLVLGLLAALVCGCAMPARPGGEAKHAGPRGTLESEGGGPPADAPPPAMGGTTGGTGAGMAPTGVAVSPDSGRPAGAADAMAGADKRPREA